MNYDTALKQIKLITLFAALLLVVSFMLTSCGTLKEPIQVKVIRSELEEVQPIIRQGMPEQKAFIYRGEDRRLRYFICPADTPYFIGQFLYITVEK